MKTLAYALLGLLAREPYSGYDLAQIMSKRVGFFWQATHGQIYPELVQLEKAGYIKHKKIAQAVRPDKKVFSITRSGKTALRSWVVEPAERAVPRDELVLKAYCLWLASPEAAIALFHEHEQQHAERLNTYLKNRTWLTEQWQKEDRKLDSQWFGSLAAIERGILAEQSYVEWCRWVVEQFKR